MSETSIGNPEKSVKTASVGPLPQAAVSRWWDTAIVTSLIVGACMLSLAASSGPIQWMDNGWLLFIASQGHYFVDTVYATAHPLYQWTTVLLFHLFGADGVAYLNSVLMVPIAYVVYRLSKAVGLNRRYALLAVLGVLLLQNVFWVSTKIEVYALHLVIVLTGYWLVFDDELPVRQEMKLFVLGVLTGLGAATHQLTFIVLFPLYLYLLPRAGWRIVVAVPGFALGIFSLYPAILHDVTAGHDPWNLLRLFLTGSDTSYKEGWEGALFRFDRLARDKAYVALVLVALCGMALVGLLSKPASPKHRTLWWAATLDLLFSISFAVNDRFTFFLPGAAMYTLLGVAAFGARDARYRFMPALTLAVVLAHPSILVTTVLLAGSGAITLPEHVSKLPYRHDVKYFLMPYMRDRSAEAFALAYERLVPHGALVLADFTPAGALRSAQVLGHFAQRIVVQCDEKPPSWPDSLYLVRMDSCQHAVRQYRAEPAAVGWILTKNGTESR